MPLDEKYLLNSFEEKIKDDEAVRNFIYVLLICRYLFDCYVIKSNAIRTGKKTGPYGRLGLMVQVITIKIHLVIILKVKMMKS